MTSLTYERHQKRGHGYDVLMPGHNYRCTEITAALGLEQLRKLDSGNQARRRLFSRYADAFANHPLLGVPGFSPDMEAAIPGSACHIFPLLCRNQILRDTLRSCLSESGIQTSHHYPAIHSFTWFGKYLPPAAEGSWANAEGFSSCELTLPLYPGLTVEAQEEVIEAILHAVARSGQ